MSYEDETPEPTPQPTPPPVPAPAPPAPAPEPEPDQPVEQGEVALPSEGKVRLVRPEPYAEEPTKDRKERVELS